MEYRGSIFHTNVEAQVQTTKVSHLSIVARLKEQDDTYSLSHTVNASNIAHNVSIF